MKLFEFTDRCFSVGRNHEILVIDYEPDYDEVENPDKLELLFTVKSTRKARVYLQPAYANAEVEQVYILGQDRLLIMVRVIDSLNVWMPKAGKHYYRINFETMSVEEFVAKDTPEKYKNEDNIFISRSQAYEALQSIKATLYTERRN